MKTFSVLFPAFCHALREPDPEFQREAQALENFIKDFAKSAKEIWPKGCIAANAQELPAAIQDLVDYRCDWFEGGIVIRPLLRLRCLGESPFGRMTFEEYRFFFFQGRLVLKTPYDRLGGDVWRPCQIMVTFPNGSIRPSLAPM